ncbi:unnamed protein product [Bemisia tabaci]|uniref:SAM domain-containing protein n=1 Tax=Bemisia tabaci TaxID=7038 RepID=A0AAI8UUU4_BEMTA|nr:unnamed protein product [Bemisia tabaci]
MSMYSEFIPYRMDPASILHGPRAYTEWTQSPYRMNGKWINFFNDAGIPSSAAATYALIFSENRISQDMLLDLDREVLKEMGIQTMGDVISILKHARFVYEKTARDTVLQSSSKDKPENPPKKTVVSTVSVPENDPYFYSPSVELKKQTEEKKAPRKAGPVLPPNMKLSSKASTAAANFHDSDTAGSREKKSKDCTILKRKIKTSVQKGVIVKEETEESDSSSSSSSNSSLECVSKLRKVMPEPSSSNTSTSGRTTAAKPYKEPEILPKAGTTFTITMSGARATSPEPTKKSVFARLDNKSSNVSGDVADTDFSLAGEKKFPFDDNGLLPTVEIKNDLYTPTEEAYSKEDGRGLHEPVAWVKPIIHTEGILANPAVKPKTGPKERLGMTSSASPFLSSQANPFDQHYTVSLGEFKGILAGTLSVSSFTETGGSTDSGDDIVNSPSYRSFESSLSMHCCPVCLFVRLPGAAARKIDVRMATAYFCHLRKLRSLSVDSSYMSSTDGLGNKEVVLDDDDVFYTNDMQSNNMHLSKVVEKKVSIPSMDYELMEKPSVKNRISLNRPILYGGIAKVTGGKPSLTAKERIAMSLAPDTKIRTTAAILARSRIRPNPLARESASVKPIRERITFDSASSVRDRVGVKPTSTVRDRISVRAPLPPRERISLKPAISARERISLKTTPSVRDRISLKSTSSVRDRISLKSTPSVRERISLKQTPSVRERISLKQTPSVRERISSKPTPSVRERITLKSGTSAKGKISVNPSIARRELISLKSPGSRERISTKPTGSIKNRISLNTATSVRERISADSRPANGRSKLLNMDKIAHKGVPVRAHFGDFQKALKNNGVSKQQNRTSNVFSRLG